MAVTKTPRLNLGKQDFSDPNWHTALNLGFDDADARLLLVGAVDPTAVDGHYIGQLYYNTAAGAVPQIWICTAAGSPGTWVKLSQLRYGETAVTAAIDLNNAIALRGKEVGGTPRNLIQVGADKVHVGSLSLPMVLQSTAAGLKSDTGAGEVSVWTAESLPLSGFLQRRVRAFSFDNTTAGIETETTVSIVVPSSGTWELWIEGIVHTRINSAGGQELLTLELHQKIDAGSFARVATTTFDVGINTNGNVELPVPVRHAVTAAPGTYTYKLVLTKSAGVTFRGQNPGSDPGGRRHGIFVELNRTA